MLHALVFRKEAKYWFICIVHTKKTNKTRKKDWPESHVLCIKNAKSKSQKDNISRVRVVRGNVSMSVVDVDCVMTSTWRGRHIVRRHVVAASKRGNWMPNWRHLAQTRCTRHRFIANNMSWRRQRCDDDDDDDASTSSCKKSTSCKHYCQNDVSVCRNRGKRHILLVLFGFEFILN